MGSVVKNKFNQISSSINEEMDTKRPRRQIFLLPSQLNAAEYQSQDEIVERIQEYINDKTGGPRGQLAGDPAVAQFIIDNAANDNN